MEEGSLPRRRAPNQAQHRQQASAESVASSLTSAGTADVSTGAAAEVVRQSPLHAADCRQTGP